MHPEAFHVGNFTVHWYGVAVALGFAIGLWLASRRGLRDGLQPDWIADLGVPLILGTVVGARTLYVVTYWQTQFAGEPLWHVLAVWKGGLVFYGGLVGATAAGVGFILWRGWPLWKLCDALAPSVALGFAFGRVGCFLNGCCHGRACDLPWAVSFPPDHASGGAPVHPTQLYDSLWALALYAALAWAYRRKQFDGQIFALFLAGYAVLRSAFEIYRGDYGAERFGPFTPAQVFSLAVLAAAATLYFIRQRQARAARKPPGP
jgi:phosphatidylglycerol:prolipoprotein diacylglycerol transferase